MVLARSAIIERLNTPTSDDRALIVTPLISPETCLSEDSVDLRLGSHFVLTRSDRLPANVPGLVQGSSYQRAVHVPLGGSLILPGHHTVLAATLEYIKLPVDLS